MPFLDRRGGLADEASPLRPDGAWTARAVSRARHRAGAASGGRRHAPDAGTVKQEGRRLGRPDPPRWDSGDLLPERR